MFFSKGKSIKLTLPDNLWERLNYYSIETKASHEVCIERLLDRYLPNLLGALTRFMEQLNKEETRIIEESFFLVMFMVSYADQDASFLESREIENQLVRIEGVFGKQLTNIINPDKHRKHDILEEIKKLSVEQLLMELDLVNKTLNKLPQNFVEPYKLQLLESAIAVAGASKESLLSETPFDESEKRLIQTIAHMLEVPLHPQHLKLLLLSK